MSNRWGPPPRPLVRCAQKTGKVLSIEEHTIHGGLGGAVAEVLAQHSPVQMSLIGIRDTFTESGSSADLLRKYGISTERIEAEALQLLKLDHR